MSKRARARTGSLSGGRIVAVSAVTLGLVAAMAVAQPRPALAATGPGVAAIIRVGGTPQGVAFDPTNGNVYVANEGGRTISVIDGSGGANDGRVTATIDLGGAFPLFLAVDTSNHQVYATASTGGGDRLVVIDESGDSNTGRVTAEIPLGIMAGPIAVDPTNHNVYVPSEDAAAVLVVDESGDADNGRVIDTVDTSFGDVSSVAVDPSTHDVYIADEDGATVAVIDESGDGDDGRIIASIALRAGFVGLGSLALDPSTHKLYAASDYYCSDALHCTDDRTVSVIDESGDADNGQVTAAVQVADGGLPGGLGGVAVDPSTHTVYVGGDNGPVSVIDESGDADNGQVVATVAVSGGGGQFLAADPSTHSVYVTNPDSHSVSVISPPADLSIAVSAPPTAPDGAQFDEVATIRDRGPDAAIATTTNLLVPAGVTVTSAPGATVESGTLVWVDRSLAAGTSVTYRVTFTVAADVHDTVALGGVAVSARYDPDPADNAAIDVIHLG